MTIPTEIQNAQVIFVSHSGGKDSQAMLAKLHRMNLSAKIVIVHSDLGEMEWEPMHNWIKENSFGYEMHVITPPRDFFEVCRLKGRLPSGLAQFCTEHLKTLPIADFIRNYCAQHNLTNVVSAIGIRAEESARRAAYSPISRDNASYTVNGWKAKRQELGVEATDGLALNVTRWYPIFDLTEAEVHAEISFADQVVHKIYSMGFSRLSCAFCVNGRIAEHKLAAQMKPELYKKMVALEQEMGKSLRIKSVGGKKVQKWLPEYCG